MKLFVWGSLIIAMATQFIAGYSQIPEDSQGLTAHQRLSREIFQQLIETNTTSNAGSTKAVAAMVDRLRAAGFPESDLYMVGPQPQHMNLVVRYRGRSLSGRI
jgi:hypothetical protein